MIQHQFYLKPEPDGLGFLYGVFELDGVQHRVDVLPPATAVRPTYILKTVVADPTHWIVFVEGRELARVARCDEVETVLLARLGH